MNIFFLHRDPVRAAQMHCDKHVVKMIVETGQLLGTAYRYYEGTPQICYLTRDEQRDPEAEPRWRYVLYGKGERVDRNLLLRDRSPIPMMTHVNHPCAVWVRDNKANYDWTFQLFINLLYEYNYRYGKDHKYTNVMPEVRRAPKDIPNRVRMSLPPLAMPDHCKVIPATSQEDAIVSYRRYYVEEKAPMLRYTRQPPPLWLDHYFDYEVDTNRGHTRWTMIPN